MSSYTESITEALDLLTRGVAPYVEGEFRRAYGDAWTKRVGRGLPPARNEDAGTQFEWDAHSLLLVMWDHWNEVFRDQLGFTERSLVSELREVRNRWAHQDQFDFDDTYRCLDSVRRLLEAVHSDAIDAVEARKEEILRARFVEQEDLATRQAQVNQRKWQSLVVYFACASLLITVILLQFGTRAWSVAVMVVITFAYFAIRVVNESRLLLGPHECGRCRRIIYCEPCPYCGPKRTAG